MTRAEALGDRVVCARNLKATERNPCSLLQVKRNAGISKQEAGSVRDMDKDRGD